MYLFQSGSFILNSGATSNFKIECDALTENDWKSLATMIDEIIGAKFCHCIGIPRGGLNLQKYLSPLATSGPCLIVDDVLTTGGSMERARDKWLSERPKIPVIGAVVFARGKCPDWIKPLFQMPEELWIKK